MQDNWFNNKCSNKKEYYMNFHTFGTQLKSVPIFLEPLKQVSNAVLIQSNTLKYKKTHPSN